MSKLQSLSRYIIFHQVYKRVKTFSDTIGKQDRTISNITKSNMAKFSLMSNNEMVLFHHF